MIITKDHEHAARVEAKAEMLDAIKDAERAALRYFSMCQLGDQRLWASGIYDRLKNLMRPEQRDAA